MATETTPSFRNPRNHPVRPASSEERLGWSRTPGPRSAIEDTEAAAAPASVGTALQKNAWERCSSKGLAERNQGSKVNKTMPHLIIG